MTNIIKALSKQFFGSKYESARKSLMAAVILFAAVYAAEFRVEIAPFILCLTSTFFTAGIMWQMLAGRRHMEIMQGMFMLPFDNRSFVFSYVLVLGAYTLITKTLLIWALFFAVASWSAGEIMLAVLCGCMACAVTAAGYRMCRKGLAALLVLWAAGILAVIVLVRQWAAVLPVSMASLAAAALYLAFADAYDFYSAAVAKRTVRHKGRAGSVFVYLTRYLMANKSYLINTVGLCGIACFLPLLFGGFQGLDMFPIGLAILCLNTPICTLLSCDPDLEQAIRMLPGQAGRFCRKYCLFIFTVNSIVASIYLCSWQIVNSGLNFAHVGTLLMFALQSAILSVILEWKHPIRDWKTESDLWHHPRKYLVPLMMLLAAAVVSTWTLALWICVAVLLMECCVLFFVTRRG
ncbi:hypothetical protein HNP82_000828 [Catenibacillus scindens]|uniref:Uncharacterized protein n=1 Tax=Catenibacillus scindens TaxID=673271 RepID=A0A7W8H8Q2_9FIRM|nr:hypothetical protein [Catenibacillus scindens]MBB5263730.1 hypothetical protein [Catenibacillus scindens]